MNIRKLCSELAKLEKTKSQAKIQAIRSIVGHLSDILWEEHEDAGLINRRYNDTSYQLLYNGKRRAIGKRNERD